MKRTALKFGLPFPAGRSSSHKLCLATLALLAPVAAVVLGGCSSSSSVANGAPPPTETSVTVGTKTNNLPTPPAQTTTNRYAGTDVTSNATSWNWTVSQPSASYNYEQQQGPNASSNGNSFGVIQNFGDFEFFADTLYLPYQFFGLNAELAGGVSIFQPTFGGFPSAGLVVGVPEQSSSCLAPDGKVTLDFIAIPPQQGSATPATDTLYGQTSLAYKNDEFTYGGTAQLAPGNSAAATNTIPFANSYCVQAGGGYGLQSATVTTGSATSAAGTTSSNAITYIGPTGTMVGVSTAITTATDADGTTTSTTGHAGFIGAVEPSAPVDLSMVTAGIYKGYNASTSVPQADPAYFGQTSAYVSSPTLTQTATSLVGGFEDFFTFAFSPTAQQTTGNVLIDFGTQDSNHNGSFPNATFTEPDPTNACPATQQSMGSDGATYCSFPVVALVSESYGKFAIFIVGPEPTAGKQLFYALVQD